MISPKQNVCDRRLSGRPLGCTEFVDPNDIRSRSVLDIGCGAGWFEKWAVSQSVGHLAGVDIDADKIAKMEGFCRSYPEISLQNGSAIELPFEDGVFDTVVAWDVIEHIPKGTEARMMKEVSRVLKDHGILYLSTPNKALASRVTDPAWWLLGHRHYSSAELRRLAERHGFDTLESRVMGAWWEVVNIFNLAISNHLLRRPIMFQKSFEHNIDREYRSDGFMTVFMKYRKRHERIDG